mmetsp:Transcript_7529/g.26293  ORF Transcript_7529/g.26293 Transcript_7529/m.26293 type:complete len:295 (+) Transcript_7529:754-1638(+)
MTKSCLKALPKRTRRHDAQGMGDLLRSRADSRASEGAPDAMRSVSVVGRSEARRRRRAGRLFGRRVLSASASVVARASCGVGRRGQKSRAKLKAMYKTYNATEAYPKFLGNLPRQTRPVETIAPQLRMMQAKPTYNPEFSDARAASTPCSLRYMEKPTPRPTSMLKTGPAKHAVMAMLPRPFLAMATFVEKSPTELPHARTVMPRTGSGIRARTPKNSSVETNSSAKTSIHVAATTKPNKARPRFTAFGSEHFPRSPFVQCATAPPPARPKRVTIKATGGALWASKGAKPRRCA